MKLDTSEQEMNSWMNSYIIENRTEKFPQMGSSLSVSRDFGQNVFFGFVTLVPLVLVQLRFGNESLPTSQQLVPVDPIVAFDDLRQFNLLEFIFKHSADLYFFRNQPQ